MWMINYLAGDSELHTQELNMYATVFCDACQSGFLSNTGKTQVVNNLKKQVNTAHADSFR